MKEFLKEYGRVDNYDAFKNIWITSDLHLGHAKIHQFEPIREEVRKFEEFKGTPDEFIIYKWNSQVGKNDLVINLGDLNWKSYEPYANKLNGIQLLVLGNHDYKPQYYHKFNKVYPVTGVWNLNGKFAKEYFLPNVNDPLLSGFILQNRLFSHYAIYHKEHEYNYQDRNSAIRNRIDVLDEIAKATQIKIYNIHGHTHSSTETEGKSINACIDYNRFELINFKEVMI